jgi:hypothetical protein
MMAPLTKRQELAQSLNDWLRSRGAWAMSPLPLRAGTPLRVDVVADDAEQLISELVNRGYVVTSNGAGQRFSYEGPIPTVTFEIRLPADKSAEPTKKVA